jgi:broad specificity phosphatase PhoE
MKDFYIVTHTEATHHIQKTMGGWSNSELTKKGKLDANLCAVRLKELGLSKTPVISSDLKRARQTSQIISNLLDSPLSLDSRLREMSFGEAEGKSIDWFNNKILSENNTNKLEKSAIPGQETKKQLATRLFEAMNEYFFSYDKLIICSHCYATTFLVMYWLKIPLENIASVKFDISPGSISHLKTDNDSISRSVVYLGDTGHLQK